MRIGLTSIFAFRPHVEHTVFLGRLLEKAGHEVRYFSCDLAADLCYNKLLKGQGTLKACSACVAGGLHSYGVPHHTQASRLHREALDDSRAAEVTASSSYTIHRVQSPQDQQLPQVLETQSQLRSSVETMYGSALRWIREEKLEAVLFFNGRMDLTRAVLEACQTAGIPYSSVERPWFGHGIQFNPGENCLGLRSVLRLVGEFKDKPLDSRQAAIAGRLLALRFAKKNDLEWRKFNESAVASPWPHDRPGPRVLFSPGSRSEVAGHPDFSDPFVTDMTGLMDRVLERLGVPHANVVLRGHPIWSQKIGREGGEKAEHYYESWSRARGQTYLRSDSNVDTHHLMKQADLVITTGGSTGVEAAALGKKVVIASPCFYSGAGFAFDVRQASDLAALPKLENLPDLDPRRHVLRFIYTFSNRYPQFVEHVRGKTSARYLYRDGADAERIIRLLRQGFLEADDPSFAPTTEAENSILDFMIEERWAELIANAPTSKSEGLHPLRRRAGLGWMDDFRERFPPGDRW